MLQESVRFVTAENKELGSNRHESRRVEETSGEGEDFMKCGADDEWMKKLHSRHRICKI
jgi:hypothetical protein